MKAEWKKYAPIALYIGLAAAVLTAGWYFVQREFNLYIQIGIGLTVLGIAAWALLDPDRLRMSLSGRQARFGSNAFLVVLSVLGIVIVINYIAAQYPQRWDLTEDRSNTLAPETVEILQSLPGEVQVTAFYSDVTQTENARQLLERFAFHSDGRFSFEFVDPVANPIQAQQAQITQDRTIVLTLAGKQEAVTFASEQELAGALVRLISGETRTIYFLTGHSEYDPAGTGDDSYSFVAQTLASKGYQVETLSLLALAEVPEDADVIVIAGPLVPVTAAEVNLIADFVAGGGALIVMTEPPLLTDIDAGADPLADYLLESWGILLSDDLVVDRQLQSNFDAVAYGYASHVITDRMEGVAVVFPTTRSVQVAAEPVGDARLVPLITTAPFDTTWAETDIAGLQEGAVTADENEDLPGPVTIAVAGEDFTSGARLAVFGDSDFASNAFYTQQNSGLMLINTIDWAAEKEDLINLTPRDTTSRVMLPPFPLYANLVVLVSVCLIPGIFVVAGMVVFIQRRRRM
jgi:ABC-type uncharacterized transport system involved in gliding motility auxiliary subunit